MRIRSCTLHTYVGLCASFANSYYGASEAIYKAILGKPPNEREKYLTEACSKDPALRAEVDLLLASMNAQAEVLLVAVVKWAIWDGSVWEKAGMRRPNRS